jgi:urate oxidase
VRTLALILPLSQILTLSRYTKADNSVIVPTDTQKQTAYIVAKQNHVETPEMYAALLAQHFIDRYPHIHGATANVIQHRWTRMNVDDKPHPHSFARDGAETRIVEAVAVRGKGISVKGGIKDLLVLKSTGSAFYGYDTTDKYTILPETNDRILSTAVNCCWVYKMFDNLDAVKSAESKFNPAFDKARKITMDTFAKEESPSVQNTMYKMSEQILEAVPEVDIVDYTLPNKHYFEISTWRTLAFRIVMTLTQEQICLGSKGSRTQARTRRSMHPNQTLMGSSTAW